MSKAPYFGFYGTQLSALKVVLKFWRGVQDVEVRNGEALN